tara:strand:+ start:281 stop:1075 length:795 start_codon:yes stop_codon:yes gene_type:complete
MDPNKEVTVIIPVFNGEESIKLTLASVASQTTPPFEVIVIDDGSDDNTTDVVESFIEAHPDLNIMLLSESHRGPSAARNSGIDAALGSWVAFLDSDDLWAPEKLEVIAEYQKREPDSNFLVHNEIHRSIGGHDSIVDYSEGYRTDRPLTNQLFRKNRFSTSAVVCKKTLLVESGGFDSSFPSGQDYELWLKISPKIKLLFVTEELGVYVFRSGNISSGSSWRRYVNLSRVIIKHRKLVSEYEYWKRLCTVTLYSLYHFLSQFRK